MAEYRKYAWWEIQAIPDYLIKEIRRRSKNYGLNYPTNGTEMLNGNFDNYKGPLRTWVRFTSNGNAKPVNNALVPLTPLLEPYSKDGGANGFVLQGGDGFYTSYGIDTKTFSKTEPVIGYDVDGKPYKLNLKSYLDGSWKQTQTTSGGVTYKFPQLSDSPTLLPQPGITGISIKQNGELILEAEVNIICYSLAQLEFLTPFFFTPGISTLLEFGYHIFNQKSLIDISTDSIQAENGTLSFFIPGGREKTYFHSAYSNGNYGVITGIITNYSYDTTDGLKYDCRVNIMSGQALYAGVNVKNSVETETTDSTKCTPSFKSFLTYVLQSLEGCITHEGGGQNLITYLSQITRNQNLISTQNAQGNTTSKRLNAQQETDLQTFLIGSNKELPNNFYRGQTEDRIFLGRKPNIDGNHLWPLTTLDNQYTKIFDKDFDSGNQNIIYIQFDLFFEILNFFFEDNKSIVFNGIDADSNPIAAHVNLISCNSDVLLIPNRFAPKFNKGSINGFLTSDYADDAFTKQTSDWTYIEDEIKGSHFEKPFLKAQKIFKQDGIYRDDHDVVINRLFYGLYANNSKTKGYDDEGTEDGKPKLIDKTIGSCAFPQIKDVQFRKNSNGKGSIYAAHTYGFLKHLYVSTDLLIQACNESSITTVKELLTFILPRINSAVNNYWELDITMGDNKLQIVDKNFGNKDNIQQIYMFDIGNSKGLFKQISFNTSLVDEQTNQIIFGGNLNQDPTDTDTQSSIDTLVPLRYGDRLFEITRKQNPAGTNSNLPQPKLEIQNNPAAQLQIQASNLGDSGVPIMTYVKPLNGFNVAAGLPPPDEGKTYLYNFKALALNQVNSNLLTAILTDKDIDNNFNIYSQVNPNLVLTVTLEGIYGFEMYQHFSISNLPRPYLPGNIIFMITEVNHIVQSGMWETAITALPRCIAGENIEYITV